MLSETCARQLDELRDFLPQLSPDQYAEVSPYFGNASIGQHVRHILELFECLLDQYPSGQINYDLRKRDLSLELDPNLAEKKIKVLQIRFFGRDKNLLLFQGQNSACKAIKTTYYRELLYNLEHCVHHQAMIRVACMALPSVFLPETFGVAKSTQEYRARVKLDN